MDFYIISIINNFITFDTLFCINVITNARLDKSAFSLYAFQINN